MAINRFEADSDIDPSETYLSYAAQTTNTRCTEVKMVGLDGKILDMVDTKGIFTPRTGDTTLYLTLDDALWISDEPGEN